MAPASARDIELGRVEHGQGHDRSDVVGHGQRQEEEAEPAWDAPPQEGQCPQGKGDVGGHWYPPALAAGRVVVDGEIDQGGAGHPAECPHHGHDRRLPIGQGADPSFTSNLQPDHQEEDGHDPAVHPPPHRRQAGKVPASYSGTVFPHLFVGGLHWAVGPYQRSQAGHREGQAPYDLGPDQPGDQRRTLVGLR